MKVHCVEVCALVEDLQILRLTAKTKISSALEVRVTAARSCYYSRSRRCIVGTAGDWKRPAEPVCFLTMMHGVSHGSLNRSAAGEKGYESDRNREKKKSITFRRVKLAFVICMKFLAAVLPSSLEVHFPQGHLLFWVAAHVNWMQQEFFLKEMFQKVERFDWQDMKQSVDTDSMIGLYKIWLQMIGKFEKFCLSVFAKATAVCFMNPLRPCDVLSWSTFSWRTQWWSSLPSEAYGEKCRKRKQNGRKRHAKTYENLEFYQLPRCAQRHWTHFYFPWIDVMLIL